MPPLRLTEDDVLRVQQGGVQGEATGPIQLTEDDVARVGQSEGREVKGLLGLLPGGVGEKVEELRGEALVPAADAIRGLFPDPSTPLESPSVGANILAGIPGTAASVVGEFLAQEIEQIPETVSLLGAGKVAKAVGAADKLKKGFLKLFPGAAFRGGMTAAGREAFEKSDKTVAVGQRAAREVLKDLTVAPTGRPYTLAEQQFLGDLLEQPGKREFLRELNSTPVPVNFGDELASRARDVDGVVNSKEISSKMRFPESDLSPQTFGQVADKVAKEHSMNLSTVAELMKKDPTELSRFTEGNFSARRMMGIKIGTLGSDKPGSVASRASLKFRKQLSDEDRISKGFFSTPGEPNALSVLQTRRFIATRQLANDLNGKGLARAADPLFPDQAALPAGKTMEIFENGVSLGRWTKMSNDNRLGLGPLTGKFVRAPEAAEFTGALKAMTSEDDWGKELWSAWKFGKTIINPKTHIRNFFGNAMLAHAAGLSPYRMDIYALAGREMRAGKGLFWDEADKALAPWTVEGAGILDDVFGEGAASIYQAGGLGVTRFLKSNKVAKTAANVYQNSERFFKHAVYVYKRRQGVGIQDAIRAADDAIINYGRMPQWVKQLRSAPFTTFRGIPVPGVPFISFTYGATPRLVETVLNKPDLINHYMIAANAWNTVAAEKAGATPEELDSITKQFEGTMPMILPTRDSSGSLMVFDVARFTPASDLPRGRLDIPIAPAIVENLVGKNPIIQELVRQGSGIDPFFKSKLFDQESPLSMRGAEEIGADKELIDLLFSGPRTDESIARMKSLARTVLPDLLGGGTTQNIVGALRGKETFLGEQITPERAIIESLFGPARSLEQARGASLRALQKQKSLFKKSVRRRARKEAARKRHGVI